MGGRRSISIAISEAILVGIALVAAFSMVAYLRGLLYSSTERFIVTPMVYIEGSSSAGREEGSLVLVLHLRNDGTREGRIVKVEIHCRGGAWLNYTGITVPPGSSLEVTIRDWVWTGPQPAPTPARGDKCKVLVYTEDQGILIQDVVVS